MTDSGTLELQDLAAGYDGRWAIEGVQLRVVGAVVTAAGLAALQRAFERGTGRDHGRPEVE